MIMKLEKQNGFIHHRNYVKDNVSLAVVIAKYHPEAKWLLTK